jgi:hypothetical protein
MNMLWLASPFDTMSTPIADMDSTMALSIPIIALVMPFIFVICIIGFGMLKDYRNKKLQHETMRMLIEKGQPIPPELFADKANVKLSEKFMQLHGMKKEKDDRKAGLILIAVGIGLYYFLGRIDVSGHGLGYVGLIPGLIGVALLINWALSRKEKKDAPTDDKSNDKK